jgi:hypothetical protein
MKTIMQDAMESLKIVPIIARSKNNLMMMITIDRLTSEIIKHIRKKITQHESSDYFFNEHVPIHLKR